jgi:hypothetical protein
MKHSNRLLLCGCGLLVLVQAANATSVRDRFAAIAQANAFRLNPPKPEFAAAVPQPERPKIAFEGFTTILGRCRVLLRIQQPAKAAVAPEISCILTEGESWDGVVALKVDMVSGTIRLNNNGVEQILRPKG